MVNGEEATEGRRRGGVGAEIFDQVERLVAAEGINRTQAFQRLSDETGRRAGTVAANYYRVARQRGAPLRPRTPRADGTRRRGGRRAAGGGADAIVTRAMESLQELSELARRQEAELRSLREQTDQLAQLRTLVSRMK